MLAGFEALLHGKRQLRLVFHHKDTHESNVELLSLTLASGNVQKTFIRLTATRTAAPNAQIPAESTACLMRIDASVRRKDGDRGGQNWRCSRGHPPDSP
jgi:hypothetical protein